MSAFFFFLFIQLQNLTDSKAKTVDFEKPHTTALYLDDSFCSMTSIANWVKDNSKKTLCNENQ